MGVLSLTGIGYKFINLITILAGDSLFLLMVYLMLTSFVLGMGIPTTPAYIVVATLGAPALIKAGAPQLVAHMFVFYYAILSFITPPVCVAAFAGAAIAESKAMETGFIALKLGIVAFIVPYIFAFNNTMLFIGDFGPLDVVQVVLTSSVGMFLIAAGMIGSATAADMTAANIRIFEICAFYVPLILIVLSLLVFMFKVKIDEKMHAKIVKELEAKLASGEIVDDEAQTAETVEAIDEEAKTLTE